MTPKDSDKNGSISPFQMTPSHYRAFIDGTSRHSYAGRSRRWRSPSPCRSGSPRQTNETPLRLFLPWINGASNRRQDDGQVARGRSRHARSTCGSRGRFASPTERHHASARKVRGINLPITGATSETVGIDGGRIVTPDIGVAVRAELKVDGPFGGIAAVIADAPAQPGRGGTVHPDLKHTVARNAQFYPPGHNWLQTPAVSPPSEPSWVFSSLFKVAFALGHGGRGGSPRTVRTGPKERRWIGEAPSRARAAKCSRTG